MPVLTKKRYRIVGDFTMRERGGQELEHHFVSGDVLPDEMAASLSPGELAALTGRGMLVEIGAKPPPRPAPAPPRRLSVQELLRATEAWPRASLEDGQIIDGPQGCTVVVLDKSAREGDLKQVLATGPDTPVVAHRVDGEWVATLSMARLAQLLAAAKIGVIR